MNTSGTAVVTYTYDAWGNILATSGSMASTLGAHNPLRYRGYVYDTETGLYYLQSRYYSPQVGRFINADDYVSTGQGLLGSNMFTYCLNNPVNYVDADGLLPMFISDIRPISWSGMVGNLLSETQSDNNPKNSPPDHPEFVPPKKGNKKVKNPNGKGWGWVDNKGDVWVWTPGMHGGEGWTVQKPGGEHGHAYPGGGTRNHFDKISISANITIFPVDDSAHQLLSTSNTLLFFGGTFMVCCISTTTVLGPERNMR